MNIFQVLSQGKSRLHEPGMSAMLGYLLDSSKDHGLGDVFIRKFIESIPTDNFKDILDLNFIDAQVSLEEPYQLDGSRKDIDIQVILLNDQKEEIHRIIIENKIKPGAANPKQLNEYYLAVTKEEPDLNALSLIFLTPNTDTKGLRDEFESLELLNSNHLKHWMFWDSGSNCIVDLIKELLSDELTGAINPINEYMRHTLKAFIRHSFITTNLTVSRATRSAGDIGEIIDEAEITLKNGVSYKVVRRDSSQIQVFNVESGDKEIARRILADFSDQNGLGIDHQKLNTRSIGKQFFEWLHAQNNA